MKNEVYVLIVDIREALGLMIGNLILGVQLNKILTVMRCLNVMILWSKFKMTGKRFEYIRTEYRHYIQDVEKEGEWKKGYKGTYDDFDLDKITDLLNQLNDKNEQLKHTVHKYSLQIIAQDNKIIELEKENEQLKKDNSELKEAMKRMAIEMMGGV